MTHQMPEDVAAQIGRDPGEGHAGDHAGEAGQDVVGGEERDQQAEGEPGRALAAGAAGERIDQGLQPVLRPDRADRRREAGEQDRAMQIGAQPDIAQIEAQRALGVAGEVIHLPWLLRSRFHPPTPMGSPKPPRIAFTGL